MNKSGKGFTIKSAYLIALTTVFLLTVFNQMLIQRVLNEQKDDASVINLAGRQRMLSQKITKEVLLSLREEISIQNVKNDASIWEIVHIGLQNGNDLLRLPKLKNEDIQELFEDLTPHLEAVITPIYLAKTPEELLPSLDAILKNEKEFLAKMDLIVSKLEQNSSSKIRRLILLEILLAFTSLMILLIEFRFIFKPLFDKLQTEKTKLEAAVQSLTESKGELFEASQRFNLSIQAINTGVWDWNILDGSEWWSDRFYELLGYKKGDIVASYDTFLLKLVHPEDRKKVEQAVKKHLEEKENYSVEIRMLTKSGDYRWFESVGQATWGVKGRPLRMVGSIIDIDQKKQLEIQLSKDERELRIQKAELQRALDQLSETQTVAGIGTWEVDLKSMNVYWSDRVYQIHEVPIGTELKVEEGINFYREDYRPVIQQAIDQAIAENKTWNKECVLVTTSGKEIWVRAIGYPVYEHEKLIALRGLFMDIDEEKTNELERIENATKLALALDASEIGIWEWDLGTNELHWDQHMLNIFGLKREEFSNSYESFASIVLKEDLVKVEEQLEEVIKNKTRFDAEFRINKPNGTIGYIVAKANLILDEAGNPDKMIGINYDISDLKQAEQTLTEAQEIGKIGNWVWDIPADQITWSEQNYKVFGQSRDFELTFENLNNITHPDDREPFQKDVQNALENNVEHNFIHRIYTKKGKDIRYIHERGRVFYDKEGKPIRMSGTSQDVTELEKVKQAIELRERQLRRFVEQAPVSVAMLDNNMNYITASNLWFDVYNVPKKNIQGKNHYDIFPDSSTDTKWRSIHEKVLKGKSLSNDRDKLVHEDGSIQYIQWKYLPWYTTSRKVGGIIMYVADVTNQVEYQDKLENLNEVLEHQVQKRTKELERANKELESFSYSVSHDLRSPLRSINGFADILEDDYRDKLDDEGIRLLNIIKSSGIKMGQLIDDILSFSRLGRKALVTSEVDMNLLVKEVLREVKMGYEHLEMDVSLKKLPKVSADLALLKQVISNLISNAIKYSSKEKKIVLNIASVKKDDYIVISIQDNGAGFDMKYHDKLFGVFQRLHSDNEFEGTGVGLAIVKRIINKHGGDVWAESELGAGSTFYISLPLKGE